MKSYRHIISYMAVAAMLASSCTGNEIQFAGGTYKGELCDSVPSGYGTWQCKDTCYTGFWKNGRQNGQGLLKYGKFTYRGSFKNGLFDGIGVLASGDSILYSGNWKAGKHSGKGIVRDNKNREINASWNNDTLITGIRYDEGGKYSGEFDNNFIPSGKGSYLYGNSQFYQGSWMNGVQHGFGIQLTPDGWFRVGTWKNGKFKGEVLNYTADRIYGIDLSRYQHKAPIQWKNLRISHLGNISKKKITGKVDYPVSYVYLKCTEGVTVINPYYKNDYKSARANNISCGAYHFFSIHTDAHEQALHFLKHMQLNKGDFPPVLDVEPSEREIRSIGGDKELFRRIRIWLNTVEERTGMRPVLYINQMFINRHLPYAPDIKRKYEVWIARYGEYKPDVHLIHWQLAPDGRVKGIRGDVDINVFNGYRPAYDRYLKSKTYKNKLPDVNRKDSVIDKDITKTL